MFNSSKHVEKNYCSKHETKQVAVMIGSNLFKLLANVQEVERFMR